MDLPEPGGPAHAGVGHVVVPGGPDALDRVELDPLGSRPSSQTKLQVNYLSPVLERTGVLAPTGPPSAHERGHYRYEESKACEAFDADAGVRRPGCRSVAQCKPPVGSEGAHPSIMGCTVQEFSGWFCAAQTACCCGVSDASCGAERPPGCRGSGGGGASDTSWHQRSCVVLICAETEAGIPSAASGW